MKTRGAVGAVGNVALVLVAIGLEMFTWDGAQRLRWGGTVALWVVPTVTVVLFSFLLLRWRHPLLVFAGLWVHGLSGLAIPDYEPFAGLLIALHAVARRVPSRTATLALVSCAAPFGIDAYNASLSSTHGRVAGFLGPVVLWGALSFTVWGFGRRSWLAERRAAEVQELRDARAAAAVHAERLRLARELHDIVANSVTAMLLQAAGARTVITDHDQLTTSLTLIEETGVRAMEELHRLLGLLRADETIPADAYDTTLQPGLDDIPQLLDTFRSTGLDVRVEPAEGAVGTLEPSVALAAVRVVQEALANARKYAGEQAQVRVSYAWRPDRLILTVRDTAAGRPFEARPVPSSGHGLRGLSERVTLVGGLLEAGQVDGGFQIRAELPAGPHVTANAT